MFPSFTPLSAHQDVGIMKLDPDNPFAPLNEFTPVYNTSQVSVGRGVLSWIRATLFAPLKEFTPVYNTSLVSVHGT